MRHETFTSVIFDTEQAREFMSQYFTIQKCPDQKGMVQITNGKTVGAIMFEQYNGTNIWGHAAGLPGTNWLTRHMLFSFFDYPFNQLDCERITVWVDADNIASRRFVKRLGFTRECVMTRAGKGGVDAHIYVMFREDCKYA